MIRKNFKRLSTGLLLSITETTKERNIYTHSSFIARDIFWKRLEGIFNYICVHSHPTDNVLDFGGGSGVFIPTLCGFFNSVTVVDMDVGDAISIAEELDIQNVKILQQNIFNYFPEEKFDVVILADVLEHFLDLDMPISWLKKNLKKNGKIFVSLPTENWVYELGRKVVKKQKPADHFHSSKEVFAELQKNNFSIMKKHFVPTYLVPVPLFEIAVMVRVSEALG